MDLTRLFSFSVLLWTLLPQQLLRPLAFDWCRCRRRSSASSNYSESIVVTSSVVTSFAVHCSSVSMPMRSSLGGCHFESSVVLVPYLSPLPLLQVAGWGGAMLVPPLYLYCSSCRCLWAGLLLASGCLSPAVAELLP